MSVDGMSTEELIIRGGAIAGAVSAMLGLLWKYIISPMIVKPHKQKMEEQKKREQEEDDFRRDVIDMLNVVTNKMDDTQDDVGYLQMHELKSAHSRLMIRGWCSDEEKAGIIALYDRYKSRGRNSLAESFADDILDLPSHAPNEEA